MDGSSINSRVSQARGVVSQSAGTVDIAVLKKREQLADATTIDYAIWQGDVALLLADLPKDVQFDLVVTSPPYNIGKSYETKQALKDYLAWQAEIIDAIVPRLKA